MTRDLQCSIDPHNYLFILVCANNAKGADRKAGLETLFFEPISSPLLRIQLRASCI